MAWHDKDSWLTAAFAPNISTILISFLVAITLPILLHRWIYRRATPTTLPTFLLIGPSGAGKTALATLIERSSVVPTHTSTAPLSIETLLPEPYVPASAHYRSAGDPAYERARRFLLLDTPGHGKLRHFATKELSNPENVRGIIFVVDAAAVADSAGLTESAEYLHDVLLSLQKRYTGAKTSKGPKEIPVLIAANKLDLFTALPAHLVKSHLEKAVSAVRKSRAKGLKDSAIALGGGDENAIEDDRENEWLGEGGEGEFEFRQMEEVGTGVVVRGGNVLGDGGADVKAWFEWVGEQL
ncbi:P-loop containing nucleoside triphosphate hydrolase protein [Aaosphaeria arxii CBS 175.79]|uniref:Signal recognition particle receptor subunit beta n=1 Tax=Aaosphaeria arxii CBS 175.79 TaxID=1450172 RepID=A0A6A5XJM2_9PLEO|nr:P-loop containing nucleoside triphosphate hydrolase protein [Aaosphaeria arxii CBS 175.79]KAF2013017.1 P-loop containing nucleoside triphosphate hydrolase protein [Aaosphaeria arxii CBS 175.79]